MRQGLDTIAGPAPSQLPTAEVNLTCLGSQRAYDKKLPHVPRHNTDGCQIPSSHDTHAHSRSLSLNYTSVLDISHGQLSQHRRRDHHHEDSKSEDEWSTSSVVDETLFDPEPEQRGGGVGSEDGYDSKDNTQSTYVSLLHHEHSSPSSPSSPSSSPSYSRTRILCCGPEDGVGQTRADQHRTWRKRNNERSHENISPPLQALQDASPATLPRETPAIPRPPRPVTRFTVDPRRRDAMYIHSLVWRADMSQLSTESEVESEEYIEEEPNLTPNLVNPAKWLKRKIVKGALRLSAKV